MRNDKWVYVTPCAEVYNVVTEQGFALTQGSTIEQIDGRNEDQAW